VRAIPTTELGQCGHRLEDRQHMHEE